MADTKISALTALDQSTADPAKTYVPLFHEDGSPLNRRMNFTNLRVGSFLHAGASGSAARFSSAGNGVAVLTNDAGNDLSRVCFGGTTSLFPALKRSGAALHLRLADDSAFANLQLANLEAATMGNTSISVAWSGTGTATTPLLVNVTADPGPSAQASRAIDVQFAGTSVFAVRRAHIGGVKYNRAMVELSDYSMLRLVNVIGFGTTEDLPILQITPSSIVSAANNSISWSNNTGNVFAGTTDLSLFRDAADRLAIRRSTNAQRFAVYRTWSAADNFERGVMSWYDSSTNDGVAGTVLRIGTEKGTVGGTARAVSIVTDGVERINIATNGNISLTGSPYITVGSIIVGTNSYNRGTSFFGASDDVALTRTAANILGITNGSTGGGAIEFTEMTAPATPAANQARVFARDNGSGKTQVCIILPDGVVTVLATQT